MSTCPAAIGPTHSFSMYVSGALSRPPFSDAASTVIASARPMRHEVRALERIDRDVDLRLTRQRDADLLADEEHRRLVALALADDDRAAHLDVVERLAHRLDGGLVRAVAVAATHVAGGRDRGQPR